MCCLNLKILETNPALFAWCYTESCADLLIVSLMLLFAKPLHTVMTFNCDKIMTLES